MEGCRSKETLRTENPGPGREERRLSADPYWLDIRAEFKGVLAPDLREVF
jgi:hypothetical protein